MSCNGDARSTTDFPDSSLTRSMGMGMERLKCQHALMGLDTACARGLTMHHKQTPCTIRMRTRNDPDTLSSRPMHCFLRMFRTYASLTFPRSIHLYAIQEKHVWISWSHSTQCISVRWQLMSRPSHESCCGRHGSRISDVHACIAPSTPRRQMRHCP